MPARLALLTSGHSVAAVTVRGSRLVQSSLLLLLLLTQTLKWDPRSWRAGRREEGDHHGAGEGQRHPDLRHGRQRGRLRPVGAHHLQRLLHHQLPGALREGAG